MCAGRVSAGPFEGYMFRSLAVHTLDAPISPSADNSICFFMPKLLSQHSVPILLQFQSIPTMGASDVVAFQTTNGDWYLVIANSADNVDNPIVDSLVLRWNGTAFQQSQVDRRSVCSIHM